ncbi:MAG TPA: HemK2/MTQ2 family protein methyltransferase [Candidatus Nanoarchaeia archaeon]|nr:HemK2/MTQ2 family protein methyltransferase [Candidatus Nanoarchaeia archaeon]
MNSIYQPAEDFYLLSKILKQKLPVILNKNPNLKFLEIGAGLGINLKTAAESGVKKENIFSCDINKEAARHCKSLGFNCVQSDLFEKIKGKFNIIIFNPPYLPEDKREPLSSKIATTGGKLGGETINIFLKQTKSYLKQDGRIFLITSSLTKGADFLGYAKKLLGKQKLFFEEVYVWELKRERE